MWLAGPRSQSEQQAEIGHRGKGAIIGHIQDPSKFVDTLVVETRIRGQGLWYNMPTKSACINLLNLSFDILQSEKKLIQDVT